MITKGFKVLVVLILSIGLTSMSFAQRQTGSVAGKVTDDEGIPLPGTSVTLSGPSILGTQTYITTETGDFRYPSVPPGRDYVLTVEMPGFQKVIRKGLIVRVGKTIRLVIELKQVALSEEVIVIAPSPIVDITATKHSVSYSSDLMENIPLARDYYDIIVAAPGVVSADITYNRTFVAYGTGVRRQQVALDGVNISDTTLGTQKIGFSFDIYEEVEFEMGAHSAEVGMAPGAYVNIVTKSGGDEFHGGVNAYYFNEDMAKTLIPDSEAAAVGLTTPTGLKSYYDFSASLGGPIIKEKLWFFVNGRYFSQIEEGETIVDGVFDKPHDDMMTFAKLTFQLRPNLKLTGMMSFRNYDQTYLTLGEMSYFQDKYTAFYVDNTTNYVFLGMANWILNQNTFLDVRVMYNRKFEPFRLNPDVDPETLYTQDLYTGITRGRANMLWDFLVTRTQINTSLNHFLDNFLGGNHEIKAGLEYDVSPAWVPFTGQPSGITGLYTYQDLPWAYHNTMPYWGSFWALTYGETREDWVLHLQTRRFSAYIQDSFTIKNRLTLNLGIRYDESHSDVFGDTYKPAGAKNPVLTMLAPNIFSEFTLQDDKNVNVWKDLSPRVGVVFDVFGDQTTSLKASWARYNEYLFMDYSISLTPAHPQFFLALWHDLDQDGILDTTDEYVVQVYPMDPESFETSDYSDPNIKSPLTHEIIVGLERELFTDFSLKLSYIYKKESRMVENVEKFRGYEPDSGSWVPVTATDPGWDGLYGTSDDKQITVYGVKRGAPPSNLWVTNVPEVKRKFQALEFVFNKRMSHGWQLFGSIVLSKLEGNRAGSDFSESGRSGAFDTPNWLVNRYGRLPFDRPVVIKLQGSVMLPLNFMLSGYYCHYSGAPWGRTLQIQLPNDPTAFEYPGIWAETVMAETPGTRRYPSRNNLDIRIEKSFNIANFGELGIFLDVLNALGERGYTITQDPGGRIYSNGVFERWPTYSRFTGIYGLRTYKICARFKF